MIFQWCEFSRSTTASNIGVTGMRSITRRRSWAARAMGSQWHFTRHRWAMWPEASLLWRMRIGTLFFNACLAGIMDDSDIVQAGAISINCKTDLNKCIPKIEYFNISLSSNGVTYTITVTQPHFLKNHIMSLRSPCGLLTSYSVIPLEVILHKVIT